MAVFPLAFLEGKFCLLLNDAQKHFPSLGPIAIGNHRSFLEPRGPHITTTIVKGRLKSDPFFHKTDNHVPWDHPTHYVFSYRDRPHDDIHSCDARALWREPDFYWAGPIAVYACQLLLYCRAASITLVGCDCMPLGGEDYFSKSVEMDRRSTSKGTNVISVNHNYASYARNLLVMRHEAAQRGVPILTLSPFMGLVDPAGQLSSIRSGKINLNGGPPPRKPAQRNQRRRSIEEKRAMARAKREVRQYRSSRV